MDETNIVEMSRREDGLDPLTELLRSGAQALIQLAVKAELAEVLSQYADAKTHDGRAAIVRNGYHPERQIQTGVGPVTVQIPKVRSKSGKPVSFRSALVPPYVRKTKTLQSAIPWLYLKGISTGEMGPALTALLGPNATGFSPKTVARLKMEWASEYGAWRQGDLSGDEWVYIWVDGIYSGLRGEDHKLCALVVIGVNTRGQKHFLAIEDGIRESKQSWKEVLTGLQSRGFKPPKLAIGDGALGFWAALEETFPDTCQQRCWVHKTANVLNCFPKSTQAKAKTMLHDIWRAETKKNAENAFNLFVKTFEDKYPKATASLQKDQTELLAFYDFPAAHWQSIRTTNPIESAFATIRHRTKRSKGCLSRKGMLHMMFKLGQCAQENWRRIKGFAHLADVINGVKFQDGERQTQPETAAA
jgi:transposase-like protein